MFRVNKKIEYGILALLYLASKEEKSASVREISEVSHVPEALLSKIMQNLKGGKIVQASQGHLGGYQLLKELKDINLLELTEILSGPVAVAECLSSNKQEACPIQSDCTIVTPMMVLNQQILSLFKKTSLEALVRRRDMAT